MFPNDSRYRRRKRLSFTLSSKLFQETVMEMYNRNSMKKNTLCSFSRISNKTYFSNYCRYDISCVIYDFIRFGIDSRNSYNWIT